jgi:hypothetical protein
MVAKEKHEGQVRKSGEPYIQHPLEVAYILTTIHGGPSTIASGLLHDVLEDTDMTKDEMAEEFNKDVAEIVEAWKRLISVLRGLNPHLKLLFTVSPIRHAKDGMHGNQLSKSALLLAISELCDAYPGCYYFPSYEIMMDELRDYRFYADDMLHPSAKAVEYIWECFCRCYFSKETMEIIKEWENIKKALDHKPFDPDSEAYRKFLSQIVLKIAQVKEKFPYLEVQKEIELCESRLKI